MAKVKKKEKEEEVLEPVPTEEALVETPKRSEKERLVELHAQLTALKVHSIGDLEQLIARAE